MAWELTGNAIGSNDFLGTTNKQPLRIKINNTERMHVSTNGNVGVGTTAPKAKLEVQGSGDPLLLIDHTGATGNPAIYFQQDGVTKAFVWWDQVNGQLNLGTPTTNPILSLRDDGVVSIGNPFPAAKLSVFQADGLGIDAHSRNYTAVFAHSDSGLGLFAQSGQDTAVGGLSETGTYIFTGHDGNANNRRFAVVRGTGAVLADGPHTGPADYAEMLPASGCASDFEPGDVLVIDDDGKLAKADQPNATNLAGVYSTKPGFVGDMRVAEHGIKVYDELKAEMDKELWLPVALVGAVPVKVSTENGPIRPGDMLTTSATPGHAMRAEPVSVSGVAIYPTGAILGKALERLESGTSMIKVLVTLR